MQSNGVTDTGTHSTDSSSHHDTATFCITNGIANPWANNSPNNHAYACTHDKCTHAFTNHFVTNDVTDPRAVHITNSVANHIANHVGTQRLTDNGTDRIANHITYSQPNNVAHNVVANSVTYNDVAHSVPHSVSNSVTNRGTDSVTQCEPNACSDKRVSECGRSRDMCNGSELQQRSNTSDMPRAVRYMLSLCWCA